MRLSAAVLNGCSDLGYQPNPTTIVTDFEQAYITAVSTTLGQHVHIQGCFYHLTQSTWRKIQELGLITRYRSEEDVKLLCAMLDGLAFLPTSDVSAGFDYLREYTPESLQALTDYFRSTYVSGTYRRIRQPAGQDGVIPPCECKTFLRSFLLRCGMFM